MSTAAPPMFFDWDGEVMRPRLPNLADRHFVVGESYQLVGHEDRSAKSHDHFFVSVGEAHRNLPDHVVERLPTPDHLRAFALIRTGWRDERTIVAASKAEARRIAAFVKPMDEFALVTVNEAAVTVWTAKSQSYRAMGRQAFQKSKDDVLAYVANLIATEPKVLAANAGRAV